MKNFLGGDESKISLSAKPTNRVETVFSNDFTWSGQH